MYKILETLVNIPKHSIRYRLSSMTNLSDIARAKSVDLHGIRQTSWKTLAERRRQRNLTFFFFFFFYQMHNKSCPQFLIAECIPQATDFARAMSDKFVIEDRRYLIECFGILTKVSNILYISYVL
jgi:hypothetical protein